MKAIVRSLVVALAVIGAIASTHVTSASAKTTITASKVSAWPPPTCDPNDPSTNCGSN